MPAVVDLAAMRDAMRELGGDPARINPLIPAELVIDHSVQVDEFAIALRVRAQRRARVRAQPRALRVPALGPDARSTTSRSCRPDTGIVHQVNLEYLARVVETRDGRAFPDTLVGTDSHTTMVNGLGVLGWGVGGIEAEAAMLGEPLSMLVPQVVGFRLHGRAARGRDRDRPRPDRDRDCCARPASSASSSSTSATGLAVAPARRPRDDREHVARVRRDVRLLPGRRRRRSRYLRLTGRGPERVALVEAYCKENLLWHDPERPARVLAGRRARPRRRRAVARRPAPPAGPRAARDGEGVVPRGARQLRRRLHERHYDKERRRHVPGERPADRARRPARERAGGDARAGRRRPLPRGSASRHVDGEDYELEHGSVVIAAITSCTNTSNPQVMIGAGLLAKKAVERGLQRKPWVKSSLAPGSKVVTEYYEQAGLDRVPRRARLQHASATAARPASATRARCRRRSRPRSPRATSSSAPCSPATATSRRASTPR